MNGILHARPQGVAIYRIQQALVRRVACQNQNQIETEIRSTHVYHSSVTEL
jgi:hypothetical protein